MIKIVAAIQSVSVLHANEIYPLNGLEKFRRY